MALTTNIGANRVQWDLRHDVPPAFTHSFEINANPGLTPTSPEGVLALPGVYTLRLTVNGARSTQTSTVRNDPRSPARPVALAAQHRLLMNITDGMRAAWEGHPQAVALRESASRAAGPSAAPALRTSIDALTATIDSLTGRAQGRGASRAGGNAPTFRAVSGSLTGQLTAQENADMAPTSTMIAATTATTKELRTLQQRWARLVSADLSAINAVLAGSGLAPIAAPRRFSRE